MSHVSDAPYVCDECYADIRNFGALGNVRCGCARHWEGLGNRWACVECIQRIVLATKRTMDIKVDPKREEFVCLRCRRRETNAWPWNPGEHPILRRKHQRVAREGEPGFEIRHWPHVSFPLLDPLQVAEIGNMRQRESR